MKLIHWEQEWLAFSLKMSLVKSTSFECPDQPPGMSNLHFIVVMFKT